MDLIDRFKGKPNTLSDDVSAAAVIKDRFLDISNAFHMVNDILVSAEPKAPEIKQEGTMRVTTRHLPGIRGQVIALDFSRSDPTGRPLAVYIYEDDGL